MPVNFTDIPNQFDFDRFLSMCNEMMEEDGVYTDWEEDFIYDMSVNLGHKKAISTKQQDLIMQLFNKII